MKGRVPLAVAVAALAWCAAQASAGGLPVVFSNDFETDTTGFTAGGTLTSVGRVSLPTDGGTLASPNQSMWLGKLGDGVAKTGAADEIVTLALSSLDPGRTYFVAFDLLVGASWDGAAGGYGPDEWRFAVDGTRLVDTMFSNGAQGVNVGAYSPQRYTDSSYTSPNGPDVDRFTGADFSYSANQGGNYGGDYAIYWFGRGQGNPVLQFVANGTTAQLEFARYGNTSDSGDEYWALDDVVVTAPEPNGVATAAFASIWMLRRARGGAHASRYRPAPCRTNTSSTTSTAASRRSRSTAPRS